MQIPHEQLGSFYLGGLYDSEAGLGDLPLLYDARDLTTHAVCVGMTGSGKTGLCIGLLEEAALDRVPALLLDPKGDITNLLLQFPELRPDDFEPWVNADDARRKGQSLEEYATNTAEAWKTGLGQWGIGGDRIRALSESADYTIYTPGSDAGVGVNILGSLAAPDVDFDDDAEMIRERIGGTVAALLGLIDVKADPVRSREGVLLATIFEYYWRRGEDLDLPKLILSIQNPPVKQLGVFDVDTFFPEKDRYQLALAFNNLVASPTFGEWLQGDPLDIDLLLFQDDGRPRHSVFYLAHLTDSERMFFVTLLLESVVTWMRRQSGTTSLRALLYFDEIFGFFPPTAEPPSKRPLLTIMKQARAFGLGAVLVTQNPVDIDYKGLSNAGTWFIGKLQTERDKARVLAGLEGAIADAGGKIAEIDFDSLINRLQSRVFLLHNVHADAPVVFHTRWVMSYLRGPLTRPQVRILMESAGKRGQVRPVSSSVPPGAEASAPEVTVPHQASSTDDALGAPAGYAPLPPGASPGVPRFYLPAVVGGEQAAAEFSQQVKAGSALSSPAVVYHPGVLGLATVHFVDKKRDLDVKRDVRLWIPVPDGVSVPEWSNAETLEALQQDLMEHPEEFASAKGPFFASTTAAVASPQALRSAQKGLADWLYYNSSYSLTVHTDLGLFQRPDESDRDYSIRVQHAAREARDAEVDALEDQYEERIERIRAKIEAESRKYDSLDAEYSSRKQEEIIGLGETVVNYFLGRKSSRLLSGASGRRRMTVKARHNLDSVQEKIQDLQADVLELQNDLDAQADAITVRWAEVLDRTSTESLKPRRTDVEVHLVGLAWAPYWMYEYEESGVTRLARVPAYARGKPAQK